MKEATAKKLIKWADDLVKAQTKLNNLTCPKLTDKELKGLSEESGVSTCGLYRNSIHIYSGILELATALGIDTEVNRREPDETNYTYEYSFKYKDFTFFEISEMELKEED